MSMLPYNIHVTLEIAKDQKSATFAIRGEGERDIQWIAHTPEMRDVARELHARLRDKMVGPDVDAAVSPIHRTVHNLNSPNTETPRSIAFYLAGMLKRKFPDLTFNVGPR